MNEQNNMSLEIVAAPADSEIVSEEVAKLAPQECAIAPAESILPVTPEMVAQVEQVATLHRQLRLAALCVTTAADWLDLEGTPYLSASGCYRLARLFRIRQRNLRTAVVESGEEKVVVLTADASSEVLDKDGWIEVVGTCSTADKFLTKGGKRKADYGHVLKKAHTSWLGSAVRQLLGLQGLQWEDLERYGIARSRVKKVEISRNNDQQGAGVAEQKQAAISEEGDTVYVSVPYKHNERFKHVLQTLGFKPRWNQERKRWAIPKMALSFQNVVDLIEKEENENA